ncbi:MAG: CBS domain-containing protein [Thermoplasmata archaeon]
MAGKMRVEELMTKDPVVVALPGSRTEVLRLLVTRKLTGVPVVKGDGTYAGFVARKHIFDNPEAEQLALLMRKDYPSVQPNASVEDVAHMMVEKGLHHLPVCKDSKVVGIVTPADLLPVVERLRRDTPVEELLNSTCVPVYEGTPVQVANEIMRVARVFALPVLDDRGRLTGIITDRDIFDLSRINGTAVIQELGLADEENPWMWEGLRNVMRLYYEERKVELPRIAVEEVMVRDVVTASSKTGVSEAARIMHRNDFGQLPVKDPRDRLLGLLTELNVIRVLL